MNWIKKLTEFRAGRSKTSARLLTDDERDETVTKIAARTDSINSDINEICIMAYGKGWSGCQPFDRESLRNYSDKTLIVILDYLMQDTVGRDALHDKSSFMRQIARPEETETDGRTARELIALQPYFKLITAIGTNHYFNMLRIMHEHSTIPALQDYSEADHETKKQIAALITVTAKLYRVFHRVLNESSETSESDLARATVVLPFLDTGGLRISDDDLVGLIMEHPDKAETIASIIVDDRIGDASLIREKALSNAQSLRAGVL